MNKPKPKSKPAPIDVAHAGFSDVLGIASAPWEQVVDAVVARLDQTAYLRDRTERGRDAARRTVQMALSGAGVIPIGGDIDGSYGQRVAEAAVTGLMEAGQLTDRAVARIRRA